MYDPKSNTVSIEVDKDLQRKIENATSTSEIYEAVKMAYESAGLTQPDYFNGDIVYPTQKAFADPVLRRRFVVDGREIILEGASEAELNEKEIEMHRQLQAAPKDEQTQRRNDRGQFVSAEDAAADAVVENYLQRRGIDPADLKEVSDRGYTRAWEQSAEEFRSHHRDWAGGQQNMQRLGEIVFELGLQDSPTAASLERAYAEMQRRGLYATDTEEAAAARAEAQIGTALSVEDIRALGHRALGLPPVNSNLR